MNGAHICVDRIEFKGTIFCSNNDLRFTSYPVDQNFHPMGKGNTTSLIVVKVSHLRRLSSLLPLGAFPPRCYVPLL
jgi:hypothetical protein